MKLKELVEDMNKQKELEESERKATGIKIHETVRTVFQLKLSRIRKEVYVSILYIYIYNFPSNLSLCYVYFLPLFLITITANIEEECGSNDVELQIL